MTKDLHTPEEWAKILKNQADYTREYRLKLYKKVDISEKECILDIGCGTGAVTEDLVSLSNGVITGVDIDDKKLVYAKKLLDTVNFLQTDVLWLPFRDNTFDLVVFNIVLTHINEQERAVKEMARVTKKNGIVLATIEPDYAGVVHYPETKADHIFKEKFEGIGVEMETGRKLRYLFSKAGLKTEIGLCNVGIDTYNKDPEERIEMYEENFYRTEETLSGYGWSPEEIKEFKHEQIDNIRNNFDFSYCPCFFAIGRKK
ncbi:MAG: class I SAM-dependent methyltransferase [Candidatus Methanofastidiosia archaeon]|jgi:SAM-dependent methyltransferase